VPPSELSGDQSKPPTLRLLPLQQLQRQPSEEVDRVAVGLGCVDGPKQLQPILPWNSSEPPNILGHQERRRAGTRTSENSVNAKFAESLFLELRTPQVP
jgi:hypothetical protein